MRTADGQSRSVRLEELRRLHQDRKELIRARLAEFKLVKPEDYFYELAYCLMTPQTSAAHADAVVFKLRNRSYHLTEFDIEPILGDPSHYVRFHKTKARLIARAKGEMSTIESALRNGTNAAALRMWLTENVKGLGYKEATHFLRNIGRNDGLAILDRHILRNLKRYGVLRSLPKSLTSKRYMGIEQKFKSFSEEIGIPIDELDLLFWSMETGEIRK